MSIWSTFYSGDINRIKTLLRQEKWEEIENDQSIQIADFSGGALQPFLIGEDFDPVVSYLKDQNAVGISTFADAFTKIIWGSKNTEYQAVILDSDFIRSLSGLSDDSISDINLQIITKHNEEKALLSKKLRKDRILERIKFEIIFSLIPVAASIGIVLGPESRLVKILVPIFSFSIFYGLRFGFIYWLNSGRRIKEKPKQDTYDWLEMLIQLRNLAKTAMKKNEKVVYSWSL